jgi:4'-phosphopantetheinyl transferase
MISAPDALQFVGRYEQRNRFDVRVWTAQLDDSPLVDATENILDAQEQQRARRFHNALHRRRFVAGRVQLRSLLARCLKTEPSQVRFRYGQHGKPDLVGSSLRFNVSHSENTAVYAVGENIRLGVDIEILRPVADADALAKRYFSLAEQRDFALCPAEEKSTAFLTLWTRKEAYIKAIGEGLSHPLDAFDVTVRSDEPARVCAVRNVAWSADDFRLFDLDIPGAAGTLAVCLAS